MRPEVLGVMAYAGYGGLGRGAGAVGLGGEGVEEGRRGVGGAVGCPSLEVGVGRLQLGLDEAGEIAIDGDLVAVVLGHHGEAVNPGRAAGRQGNFCHATDAVRLALVGGPLDGAGAPDVDLGVLPHIDHVRERPHFAHDRVLRDLGACAVGESEGGEAGVQGVRTDVRVVPWRREALRSSMMGTRLLSCRRPAICRASFSASTGMSRMGCRVWAAAEATISMVLETALSMSAKVSSHNKVKSHLLFWRKNTLWNVSTAWERASTVPPIWAMQDMPSLTLSDSLRNFVWSCLTCCPLSRDIRRLPMMVKTLQPTQMIGERGPT